MLEYLSQSNDNSDCVSESERFKFLDDLSILEIVNLLTIGITSYNLKYQIPSDVPQHNQYIPSENLESQEWLNKINQWTINQKMMVNEKKTKTMIFNYTNNYQFTTRLSINDKPIEVINSTKLLGTIITDDLKWDANCANLVKKANGRMELMRKVSSFGLDKEELKNIYFLFVRSVLEQSATVWHSSLTQENKEDLERVQKSAIRIIMGEEFKGYQKSLDKLDIETLDARRESLCLNFALKTSKNPKMKKMFPLKDKHHDMQTRQPEKYVVQHANTERLKKSSIIYMQNLLNIHENK